MCAPSGAGRFVASYAPSEPSDSGLWPSGGETISRIEVYPEDGKKTGSGTGRMSGQQRSSLSAAKGKKDVPKKKGLGNPRAVILRVEPERAVNFVR